jgi:hypothetical protein
VGNTYPLRFLRKGFAEVCESVLGWEGNWDVLKELKSVAVALIKKKFLLEPFKQGILEFPALKQCFYNFR